MTKLVFSTNVYYYEVWEVAAEEDLSFFVDTLAAAVGLEVERLTIWQKVGEVC